MSTTEAVSKIAAVKASKTATKEKKAPTSKPKSAKIASHPPYFEMIKDALLALKEKGGSSPYAIGKYIEENQKSPLPANFRKILGQQLKNSAAKGKLIKVKASYKLSDALKKATAKPVSSKNKSKKAKQIVDAAAKPAKKKAEKSKQIVDAAAKPAKKKAEKSKQIVEAAAKPAKKAEAVKKTKKAPVKKPAKAKAKQPKSIKSPVKKAKKAGA